MRGRGSCDAQSKVPRAAAAAPLINGCERARCRTCMWASCCGYIYMYARRGDDVVLSSRAGAASPRLAQQQRSYSSCLCLLHSFPYRAFVPAGLSLVLRRRHRTVVTRRARDVVVSASSRHCQARAPGSCGFSGPMGRHADAGVHCSVPLALTVVALLLLASVSVSHGIRPAPGKCSYRMHA